MPTWRSDSSANTTLSVELVEVAREINRVQFRVDWSVTTGSSSALGNNTGNHRIITIKDTVSGATLTESQIRPANVSWTYSSTYSGSWLFWMTVSATSGSVSIRATTNNTGTQSLIWTQYTTAWSVSYSETWTEITLPSGLVISPTIWESPVSFSWTAGKNGTNNTITGMKLQYRKNSGTATDVTVSGTTHSLNLSGWARGDLLDAKLIVTTQKTGTKETGWCTARRKNRTPNQPTSPTTDKVTYQPGDTVKVTFTNTGDPDSNLSGFECATDQNETIVGSVASSSATQISVNTAGWPQGAVRRFRVRGYDALGIRGAWSTYTAAATFNSAPFPPTVSYPVAGATLYQTSPRILLETGAINDGPSHILCVNADALYKTSTHGSRFSCGTQSQLAAGRKVVFRSGVAWGASASIGVFMSDGSLDSTWVPRQMNIASASFTDGMLSPGMKIKAIHITELRDPVNNLRKAYGLPAKTWTPCIAGQTKINTPGLITELQSALQDVMDRINGWDTANATFDIPAPGWVTVTTTGGVSASALLSAIMQLRMAISMV